ncbi:hypothetical protein [Patiriisocius marinus]|uniref:DUF4258 domain-containing protein n=1 Tax=Patiriisocius marinus TaxID=1397112 RepID=A0A5J4IRL2_9FLAO|nr:hypothetical protein [Patiriisocius marinus]GER60529.1 hypothetical protein ULMA_26370 [Patiriisocius marinus]
MNIAKRFVFFGFGFVIGLILLFFFLGGKKTGCDYGPEARVLKNIRIKPKSYSEEALKTLAINGWDSTVINIALKKGDVLFSEGNRELDSCKQYVIEHTYKEKPFKMLIENCDSIAKILTVESSN